MISAFLGNTKHSVLAEGCGAESKVEPGGLCEEESGNIAILVNHNSFSRDKPLFRNKSHNR